MKRATLALLAILLAVCLLAACGGDAVSNSASMAPSGSSALESDSTPVEELTTHEIAGYYTVDVPADLNVTPMDAENGASLFIFSPDQTWRIFFTQDGNAESAFTFAQVRQSDEGDATFAPLAVGVQEGYMIYDSEHSSIHARFPYGSAESVPFGRVTIDDQAGGDAMPFLEDPLVQSILASVKVIKEPESAGNPPSSGTAPSGTTSYNVGTEFAVFAVNVPDGPEVEVGADFMRIEDAAAGWHIDLWSMMPGPFTTATSATSYLEWYTREYGSAIEECTLGAVQGYMVKAAKDGTVFVLSYAFDGLTGEPSTWGAIEISSTSGMDGDAAPFLDDPVVQGILNSVHVPV